MGAGLAGFVGHGGVFGYAWSNSSPFGGGLGTTLAHGVSQGVLAQLRGGSFKSGFIGAIAGGIGGFTAGRMMGGIQGISAGAVMARTTVSAVFDGVAARATAAAFSHLFNDEADNLRLLGQRYK